MNPKKTLLFDLDGMIIRPRHKYFSEKFAEDYHLPLDDITPFFKGPYKKAATGQVDIKEILPEYLAKWNWPGTVNEFLTYWFEGERDLDMQMVKLIKNMQNKDLVCCLVSDNEKHRQKYVMDVLNLKNIFDYAFFSCDLGVTKSDKVFYIKILEILKTDADAVFYWDDDQKNVDIAKSVGIDSFFYNDYGELVRQLDKIFPMQMKDVHAFDTQDFYCDMIFTRKIKIEVVRETENLLAFYHTRPAYPTHIVIVPKKHITKLTDVKDFGLISSIFEMAKDIILEKNLDSKNFRIITNGGSFQDSKHLHFHLISDY